MKKSIILILTLAAGLLFWQCSKEGAAEQQTAESAGTPVKTIRLSPRPFSEYLQITGTVQARNRISMVVEEGGVLNKIVRDKGRFAAAGDTLAVLENKILEASYNEARAALQQGKLDYTSKKVLYEKRAISENEYLVSKFGLERAQAAYELARARYSKLFITAPLNGYVNDRFYDIGAYAMPMSPIFDFIDNEYMKITAGVAERFLNDIRIGTPVEITFDAFPEMEIESRVSFINRSIDPQSRTFQVEIAIPNPDRKLAPQIIANLKLLRRAYADQIVVPLNAVIESEQGRFVFVAAGEQARKVAVELKAIYEDSVLVGGLAENQQLIVVGQQELTDGDPLIIQND